MNPIVLKIIQHIVGKNSAHIARKISTWIGGLLMVSVAYPIDPAIATEGFENLTPAEINDGLTMGELFRGIIGFAMFGASRAMSFLRARNLDWLAKWFGLLVGRSVHSLLRALLTVTSSFFVWIGFNGGTEEGLLASPVTNIIGGIITLLATGLYSSIQDSRKNPVARNGVVLSPPANQVAFPQTPIAEARPVSEPQPDPEPLQPHPLFPDEPDLKRPAPL